MKKLISMGLAAMLCGAGMSATAQDTMKKDSMKDGMHMKDGMGMKMDMKKMDANSDGMISKQEFMKYHEAMFDGMKKDSNGMVSMKDMDMMNDGKLMKK